MIEKMSKYNWIILNSDKDAFLESLRGLGVVDIKRSSKAVDDHSQALIEEIENLKSEISDIEKGSSVDIRELEARLSKLDHELAAVEIWGDYDKSKLEAFGLRYYCVPEKKYHSEWENAFPIQVVGNADGKVWFVTVGTDSFPMKETDRPQRTASEIKAEIQLVKSALSSKKSILAAKIPELPSLKTKVEAIQSNLSLYFASLKAEQQAEGHLVIFEGFAPSGIDSELSAVFDSMSCVWLRCAASKEDNPPIKLRNNGFSKQFEVLTRMYGMPCYNEFDPTIFLSIFFLLFFSMCMGDAGYGLVLMLLGFLLKGRKGGLAELWRLIIILGAGTTVVGVIMGGFFGINLYDQAWVPVWLKNIMVIGDYEIAGGTYAKQMVLSLVIGVVHICLALIMKAVWAIRKNGFKNSLSALGWTILIVGAVIALSIGLLGVISEEVMKWGLIGIAVISALGIFLFNQWGRNPLLNIGSGLWDSYSMVSGLMGDVLSYIRLYALGLSGSLLGSTFNQMAEMVKGNDPTWQWVPFVLIIIFGHALNIAMSCLGAFVHPLRLNFVEFFKNSSYEGMGQEYNPIKK